MPRPQQRDPAKERYWRRLLRLWLRSGQTGRDFCAAHGLSEPSFYAWRREIARRDHENTPPPKPALRSVAPTPSAGTPLPAFVEVTVAAEASAPAPVEVVLANGRRIRVPPGFDADLLRQLLRVLEEPSC